MSCSSLFVSASGWGPQGRRAALSLTFDNFGEAAAIETGSWGDRPIGSHNTAAFLPRLLRVLGDVRATYFVEASNEIARIQRATAHDTLQRLTAGDRTSNNQWREG